MPHPRPARDMRSRHRKNPFHFSKYIIPSQTMPTLATGGTSTTMEIEVSELDQMQAEYKAAVDEWVAAIRNEEALASVADHSVTDIDAWETAADAEEEARDKAKDAKQAYEDALREKFFHF